MGAVEQTMLDFKGATYDPEQDQVRLSKQAAKVWEVLKRGQWYTLRALSIMTGAPEASVSARIRDLRRPENGSHTIERRRVEGRPGLWEYRWVP